MHRDFPCWKRSCAKWWVSEIGELEKVMDFWGLDVYFLASSGMKMTGEIGERS
jgi:hypothetical protein